MANSMWKHIQGSEFGFFSHTSCWKVYKIKHTAMQYWRTQWFSTWYCHRMQPLQQVSSSNICPARDASVNCKCCYCVHTEMVCRDRCGRTWLDRALTSTPSNTFGMNWNTDCEPYIIAQHQCLTSLVLFPEGWRSCSVRQLLTRLENWQCTISCLWAE